MSYQVSKASLADCVWPPLPEPHLTALREAVAFVLEAFDPVGVFACGSVLRGVGDASSDVDVYVIHQANFRQRVQKFFAGVPAEIFVNPPAAIEAYFEEERGSRRLLTAHMLATGALVLDRDPVVEELRSKAKAILESAPEVPSDTLYERYSLAIGFEDALDKLEKDPATARMILGMVMERLLGLAFKSAGVWHPRAKDVLSELERVNKRHGELARTFYTTDSLEEQFRVAGLLMDDLVGARGFFEWSSPPDVRSDWT